MTLVDDIKDTVERRVHKAKNEHAARQQKAESDITPDASVAGSRAGSDGEDGNYVGRTTPQYDADVQQSGAEARSEASRLTRDQR